MWAQDPPLRKTFYEKNVSFYHRTCFRHVIGFCGTNLYALKAHLFGYLFSRDNLSAVNRELVTVSTLASLETVQNQLRSHLGILKNLGLNETELKRVVDEIRQQNPTAADKAESVLKDVVKAQ